MKLWGGRFAGPRDLRFEQFSQSFSLDRRLIFYDLLVNRAYVKCLGEAGVLRPQEVRRITRGLEVVRRYVERHSEWAGGKNIEDVHTWVEAALEKQVGEIARKLRTGRSRNDLVATDMRLYVKAAIRDLQRVALGLLEALLVQSRQHLEAVMPGYTHLQPAQPVLFSHYLLAYFEMLSRDISRFEDCRERADELPLGAGALAGASFPLDRSRLAKELGFARVARNSLDVTSDRDFVCELLFAGALTLTHLSRLAEDLIIYSSPGFGYVELADAYSTGSSLMPQKKNPDSLELIRGKAATILGKVTGMLALLKGLPLAYNRDLQEDKAALFDAIDATRDALEISARVVHTLRIYPDRMKAATDQGFLTATDLAEELARRGVPFAQAHTRVGRLVRYCADRQKTFADLTDAEAQHFIPPWDAGLRSIALSPLIAVSRRNVVGGTSPNQVVRQVRAAERAVAELKRKMARRR